MELDGDNGLSGWTSARILRVVAEEVPGEVETFFSRLEAEHGTPDGKGFLSELSTHFANYCRSRTGLGIALNRPSEPLPRMWRSEEWCVTRVSAVDNDRDGEMEIAFNDQGGGSGTFAVREKFLHWPMDAPAPTRGFEYGTLQVDQTGTPFDLAPTDDDAGAPGNPSEWSFNVPGNPEWDALFLSQLLTGYLDEGTARAAMASDLTLVSASMESATLSLCQQHGDYMRSYADRETYRVLGLTYARLLEGLKRSSGIDATSIEPRWSDAYFHAEKSNPLDRSKDRWDRLTDLEETLGKLATLPDALRTGTNYGPYEQALEDARRLRLAATDATYDFAPEGVDPESIPQGHPPPRFGGIYEIIEMDSSEFWIVDVTTGEKIRQAGEDMHLLGGLHADHQRYHCHEGRSSIPFLGIAKGDEVDRMTFDCRIPTQDLETSFATLRRANDSGHGAELVAERVFERLTGFESGCGWSREHKTRETTVFGVSPSFQTSRGKPTWEELVEKGASLCLRSNLAIRSSPLRVLHDGSASQRRTSSKTRMRR